MFELLGVIFSIVIGLFLSNIIDCVIISLKIMLILICLVFILALLKFFRPKETIAKTSEQEKQIKILAEMYIDKFINDDTDKELTYENYKEFNNIVQIENDIIVQTNYSTEIVPYQIRSILYTEFIKRIQKLKRDR